jgi:hypothetical protein
MMQPALMYAAYKYVSVSAGTFPPGQFFLRHVKNSGNVARSRAGGDRRKRQEKVKISISPMREQLSVIPLLSGRGSGKKEGRAKNERGNWAIFF